MENQKNNQENNQQPAENKPKDLIEPKKKSKNHRKGKPQKSRDFVYELSRLFKKNQGKIFSVKRIFRELNVTDGNVKSIIVEALEKLLEKGDVYMTEEGDIAANVKTEMAEGIVDFVNSRFCFVIVEGRELDVKVNAEFTKFAFDGDRVKLEIFPAKEGVKPDGRIIEVLQRKVQQIVGKLELGKFAFVLPDNKKIHQDIFIDKNKLKNAKNGDKVIVKIVKYPQEINTSPVGEITEVLGKAGENNTEMHAILAEYGLPLHFPQEVVEEAKLIKAKTTDAEIKKRRDFRNVLTFTIDPADAKDFDDAISMQKLENGHWEIGVHIADVTHYVKENTILEDEAKYRATSVYLVDRVVPMLPERLSNELCSLRPNEDKLTFSAVFEIDDNANVHKEWFGRTIIHSDRRFSYEDAQERLEKNEGDLATELIILNNIAKKFTEKRFQKGAISFETQEVKFKLDEKGVPIGIYIKQRKDAHRLIEEYMLLANKQVAEFIYKQKQKDGTPKPMVYRVHEPPVEDKLLNFATFARQFGYEVKTKGKEIASSLNKMLTSVQNTPQQNTLESLAIRTMAKARYSIETIGHYGLAFQHYTHFTSPIRRYPDMMAHRLLAMYLNKKEVEDVKQLEKQCKHSTDMEKKAADAERASTKYKQVEYMQILTKNENKIFDGVITGVTEWGVYVEITETKCEGMVRLGDIYDDMYYLEAEKYRLVGSRSKRIITFGDVVRVKVKDTNLEKRTMDLLMVK